MGEGLSDDWPDIVDDSGERCSNCRCPISAADTPCVWLDKLVCALCYELLQSGSVEQHSLVPRSYATPVLNNVGIPLSPGEVGHAVFEDVALYQRRITG